ncbi:hypothetical protein [Lichenibacterium dinghuense]|uniref:hypothetical protein n=1 Tax=Lichenibacterium dinghuense TaxID=2895977 RepID=UPI001F30F2CA|nr:hypothetical protein [Lichenibacterium sp. 6Y81]
MVVRGIEYRWRESHGRAHTFERFREPGILETFDDARLTEEAGRHDYIFNRDHHAPGRERARSRAALDDISSLPEAERPEVLRRREWVGRFLALVEAGRAVRTHAGATEAIAVIAAELEAERLARLGEGGEGPKQRVDAHRESAEAECPPVRRPSSDGLLRWTRAFVRGGRDPLALRDRRHVSSGHHRRLDPGLERLVAGAADGYLSMERPTIDQCLFDLKIAVRAANVEREREGLRPFACPSKKVLTKAIGGMPKARVHAARYGAGSVENLKSNEDGFDVTWIGQRVEIDEWEVQVQAVLEKHGVWQRLDAEWRKSAGRVRLWACTALDTASRIVLAMSLSRTGNTAENAVSCLAMVVSDKTRLARWAGAQTAWDMSCVPTLIVTDGGAGFKSDAFKMAAAGLHANIKLPPAARPRGRPRVERFFRTLELHVGGRLPGRTFSNPVDRGDYDSAERAAILETVLRKILILSVVDSYHCRPHRGLRRETPIDAFERLDGTHGIGAEPGPTVRRNALGVDRICRTGPHGVGFLDLTYRSAALVRDFNQRGARDATVRVDAMDLGCVSVLIDGEWETCVCRDPGMQGTSLAVKIAADQDLRRRFKAKARVRESVVLDAIAKTKELVEAGVEQFGLGRLRPTAEQLDRIEAALASRYVPPWERGTHPTLEEVMADATPRGTPFTGGVVVGGIDEVDEETSPVGDGAGTADAVAGAGAAPPPSPPDDGRAEDGGDGDDGPVSDEYVEFEEDDDA